MISLSTTAGKGLGIGVKHEMESQFHHDCVSRACNPMSVALSTVDTSLVLEGDCSEPAKW